MRKLTGGALYAQTYTLPDVKDVRIAGEGKFPTICQDGDSPNRNPILHRAASNLKGHVDFVPKAEVRIVLTHNEALLTAVPCRRLLTRHGLLTTE